jgi:hypothetical protein
MDLRRFTKEDAIIRGLPSWFRPTLGAAGVRRRGGKAQADAGTALMIPEQRVATHAKTMRIGGMKVAYLDGAALTRVFGVSRATVVRWEEAGILPEPFTTTTTFSGRVSRVWAAGQVRAVVTVFNYLYAQGATAIHSVAHKDVLKFIHAGSEVALVQLKRQLARRYAGGIKEGTPDIQWET